MVLPSPNGHGNRRSAAQARHVLTVDVPRWFGGEQDRWRERFQNPIGLDERTEPNPDIVLARMPWRGCPHSHPGPSDIFLLIEAADSTLRRDPAIKLPLYARSAIVEAWIVDLTVDRVIVHRNADLQMQRYASRFEVGPDGNLEIAALPGITFPRNRYSGRRHPRRHLRNNCVHPA